MRDKKIECYQLLKRYSDYLNKQQYSTLKGQIQAGDIDGFYKGIKLVVNRNIGGLRMYRTQTAQNIRCGEMVFHFRACCM